MGIPLGEAELRIGEEQSAEHLAVEHVDTAAHMEICEKYKAQLEKQGFSQDMDAQNESDTEQVIRTMTKDGKTLKLKCRNAADRVIVRLDYGGSGE